MSRLSLALLAVISLVMTTTVNGAAGAALAASLPSLIWVATSAIPSFLVAALGYLLLSRRDALGPPFGFPMSGYPAVLGTQWLTFWLIGAILASLLLGRWFVYATTPAAIAAFLVFGALGEELIFRGIIYDRAEAVAPGSAIGVSAVFFALHHLELHDSVSFLAVGHVLVALPLGWVLGHMRRLTGSLWPGYWLHLATNIPFVIAF